MNYWRFIEITRVTQKIHQIESGEGYIEEGELPESAKDMIAQRVKQR